MNNSTVNFTTPEASTNSTNQSIGLIDSLDIGYSIAFLFGLPTHSYVIWLIITGKGSGVASEFFNLSLSVCEIGISLNGLIFALSNYFFSLSMLKAFLLGLTFTGHPLFQCLICVERYLAVVHPVIFLKFKPLRYRVICCTVVWIMNLGACLVCKIILLLYVITVYVWLLYLAAVPPLLLHPAVLSCGCSQSSEAVRTRREREREREEENHMKRRAFNIILISTVNMVIVYVPFTITGLLNILTRRNIPALWLFAVICYVLASFIQPVLYLHRAGKLSCLYSL